MALTRFSDFLASLAQDDNGYGAVVPDDWLQGRTTYGGLSAALCVAAAEQTIGNGTPLRSAQFCFVGPTFGVIRIQPSILRRGKATTLVAVDLYGQDGLAVRGTLVFGKDRPSDYSYPYQSRPQVALPESCAPFFGGSGTPAFASHFDARQAGGAALVSGATVADFTVWVRHVDVRAGSIAAGLVALGDALPPPAMALFKEPSPISTVTWSIDFPVQPARPPASGWFLINSRTETIGAGYSTQHMTLWSAEGDVAMIGRQNVAIFA